jgi:PAS domain S-box-containing protein
MKDFHIDELPNPTIVYDSEWRIRKINKPALVLLGYSKAEEICGRSIHHILTRKKHLNEEIAQMINEVGTEASAGKEIEHISKDGSCIKFFSQFKSVEDNESPGTFFYLESGFYCYDMLQQASQVIPKELDYWRILADNVPYLMVFLVDKKLDILCSLGHEEVKQIIVDTDERLKNLFSLLPPEFIAVLEPLFNIVFEGTSVSREFTYSDHYYSVSLKPLPDKYENFLCVVVIQNITDTKLVEKKLLLSKEEAEYANEAKNNFIAKMSHEIRTPLNAILGFTHQLNKTKLTKRQSRYLEVVISSSQHLLSTIDEILVLSRIESGQFETEEEPFSLENVIKDVIDLFWLRVKEKDLDFQIRFDPPIREVLLGDPSKIRQVLINLIANAIKFTNKGGILMDCSVIDRTKEQLTIRFDITDTGIGIKAEEIKLIFAPFHQVDNSISRNYFGSGLGLTISNDLLKSMGSEITVKSSPGIGSTFSFILSLKRSKTQLPRYNHDKSLLPFKLSDQVRILFIDDDPVSRMLGKVILDQYHARYVFAKSGGEAIKKFKPGKFDIVLLDINMPGISGVDVANHIRNIEIDFKSIPPVKIIAMTANVLKKHLKEYLRAGMDDFILKPYKEADLIEKIITYSTKKFADYTESAEGDKLQGNSEDYDLGELLRITKGDKEYTLLMLDSFLENGLKMLHHMNRAYNSGDYQSIAEAAHRLLPSVEHLGFKKTTSLLKVIENRYLRKGKFRKDPQMIKHMLNEVESCLEKIRIARDDIR